MPSEVLGTDRTPSQAGGSSTRKQLKRWPRLLDAPVPPGPQAVESVRCDPVAAERNRLLVETIIPFSLPTRPERVAQTREPL